MAHGWAVALLLFAGVLAALPMARADQQPEQLRFYVSKAGNDAWSGRMPGPNETKTDGPFATQERARDEIRKLKESGPLPGGGAMVIVRGGVYSLEKPFELGPEDSGTEAAPIVYVSFPGEEVRLVGGKTITGFAPVSDAETLKRLDENARGNVVQADLKALGIADFGPPDAAGAEVFFNDEPMVLARWPNEGFVRIVDVVEQDGHQIHGIPGSKTGKFTYEGDRPKRWVNEQDPWVHGYWFWDWSDQRQRIASIDTENAILSVAPPYHGYGYRKGQWYYAFNLLSELDSPGEWYIDRERGILYFWPPEPVDTGKTVLSISPNLVAMKDVSFVTLRGFVLEASRSTAITVTGGKRVQIAACVIRNVGGAGAQLSGSEHGVAGCEVYRTGGGGLSLSGGDRATLTPGGLYAENNHIHDYGRINRMYTPGIALNGVGNRAAHNLIHTAPHIGVMFGGNDHVIEFNEIHHVCMESNDAGAIYAGRNWTMRGNVIRYNYFHHISGFEDRGCVGVYLDDMFASAAIYGNVFYKVTRAAFIGGGRDCSVENNVFVDCNPALHVDARALNWAGYCADEWIKEAQEKGTLQEIAYTKPPYSDRYPKLVNILNENPKAPVGNIIARNICWGGKWDEIEEIARPLLTFENNLIDEDPHFVDVDKQDFRLKDDSQAFKIGFKMIPIDQIGLKKAPASGEAADDAIERILDAPEVRPHDRVNAWLNLARRSREEGDLAVAEEYGEEALEVRGAQPEDRARVRLEQGHTAMAARKYAKARRSYARIVRMAGAPAYYKSLAQLRVAQCYRHEKRFTAALRAYRKLPSLPDVPPHHRWEAEEAVKALDRSQAGLSPRDPSESRMRLPEAPAPAVTLYIAPDGTDENPGTHEQPFATLQRALDVIVALKARGPLPEGGVKVCFREGVYRLRNGLKLGPDASGREGAPITITAFEGEPVRLSGGVPVSDFRLVDDPAILARLPEKSRGRVLVADLKAQGVTEFGQLAFRGFSCGSRPSVELYFDGEPMTPARWPNEGFVRTGKVLEPGSLQENRGGVFEYDGDRPARWQQARDVWLYGYWYYDWADNAISVTSIDPQTREIRTAHTSTYGMREGQPYYAFNLLEEIDLPGEWYLDRDAGRLYLYPPSDANKAAVELSMVTEPLVAMEGASYVTLQGLTLEMGAGDGVAITGGEHCLVAGCLLRRLGAAGVVLNGGHEHGALSCDIHTVGRGGTVLTGGDRKTLTPGRHFVENCHIYDFSRIDRTYTPAVQIEGVGNRVSHNLFHDSPCHAIRLEGNDHLIEFNEIHNVVRESDDQGGLDMFLNPSYRGNVLRYNYWHDIGSGRACGQAGIRLDDAISGTLIYGNVFHRCSESNFGGVQIHGGKDNWVDNNIFVDCRFGVSFSPWGKDRWTKFLSSDSMVSALTQQVDIAKPPYSTRYPALQQLGAGNDVNMIWRNIVYRCGDFLTRDQGIQVLIDNYVTRQDPGFINEDGRNFTLKEDSPVCDTIGFQPIPFDEIGPYEDAFRAALKTM